MIFDNQNTKTIAPLIHEKSVEILFETGFCVPDTQTLTRLEGAEFIVDRDTQMVRVPPQILETALSNLPKEVNLYDRKGVTPIPYDEHSCFMGAGTPVNVLDLESGERRSATREDVQQLVTIQDALPMVDIVRPTVTATDQGEHSDLVEIAELLLTQTSPHFIVPSAQVISPQKILAACCAGQNTACRSPC